MDPVVITAVAPDSPLTFITNPKTPRQPLPASDGTDYLKTIPGFSAIRNGGTNGDPVLRGMFGSRLNILTNGSAMPGACPARMDAPSSYISPETFDQLTVIKGPQTVLWGPGASAGTVRFDRDTPRFTEAGVRFDGSLTGGSFGRNDQTADFTAGNESVYVRVTGNHSHSQDYKDGNGLRVPSRWDKWNTDLALGFTPDADTLFELTAGTGDGEARYAGRGMDGSKFKRESFGLRFEKRNLGATLEKIEAQLYYNYADHVMDNYTLRRPDPNGPMPMAMAADVDRATWGGRVAATLKLADALSMTGGLDVQQSRHRGRSGTDTNSYRNQSWEKDAEFSNVGLFSELTWRASERGRLIGGARVDRASAKDFRPTSGHMMMMPNPTAGERRDSTLPSGFLRYEQDLESLPATWYVGLGHVQRFPDYWELFSPGRARPARSTPSTRSSPKRPRSWMWACSTAATRSTPGCPAMPATCGLHPVRLPPGRHDGTDLAGLERERAHRRRRAGRVVEGRAVVDPGRHPGLCLGREPQRRPRPAPDPAAGSQAQRRLRRRRLVRRRALAPGRAAALRAQQRQRGRPGLRPQRGLRRVLAERGLCHQQAGQAVAGRGQPVRQGLCRAPEPGRRRRLRLPGHSRVNEPGRSVWARVSVKY